MLGEMAAKQARNEFETKDIRESSLEDAVKDVANTVKKAEEEEPQSSRRTAARQPRISPSRSKSKTRPPKRLSGAACSR